MKNPVVGLAVLGFQGYSRKHCKQVLKFFRGQEKKVIAFLYNSFGESKRNIKKWYGVADDNAITQVYISNEVDRRKARIDTGSVLHRVTPKKLNEKLAAKDARVLNAFKARAKEIYDFHKEHGKGELRIAVGLEHQMTKQALNSLVDAVRSVAPDATIVSNPVRTTANFAGKGRADVLEIHEVSKLPEPTVDRYVVGNDGYDICLQGCGKNITNVLSNSEVISSAAKFANAEYYLFWHSQFNSLSGDSGSNPKPADRKSSIQRSCIKQMKKLANKIKNRETTSKEPTPVFKPKNCKRLLNPFKVAGFLWKESDHGGLVVLLPAGYTGKIKKVIVREPKVGLAGVLERFFPDRLEFTGVANGDREHYRNRRKAPHRYMENSVVTVVRKDGKKRCFLIKNPGIRNGQ